MIQNGIAEYKCPYSAREITPQEACQSVKNFFCKLENKDLYDLWSSCQGIIRDKHAAGSTNSYYTPWFSTLAPSNLPTDFRSWNFELKIALHPPCKLKYVVIDYPASTLQWFAKLINIILASWDSVVRGLQS